MKLSAAMREKLSAGRFAPPGSKFPIANKAPAFKPKAQMPQPVASAGLSAGAKVNAMLGALRGKVPTQAPAPVPAPVPVPAPAPHLKKHPNLTAPLYTARGA